MFSPLLFSIFYAVDAMKACPGEAIGLCFSLIPSLVDPWYSSTEDNVCLKLPFSTHLSYSCRCSFFWKTLSDNVEKKYINQVY